MHLIVGLGNPGTQYQQNRHNIGFMCCDFWLKNNNALNYKAEHKALVNKLKVQLPQQKSIYEIIIAKPQTFMNKSGESVISLMNYYKVPKENILVIHDDIDQAFGAMKIHFNRGHGGQNGVRNISELLGTAEYSRLKLGVGRPAHPDFDIGDYVLSNFPDTENKHLDLYLKQASQAIDCFIQFGHQKASTLFNGTVKFT